MTSPEILLKRPVQKPGCKILIVEDEFVVANDLQIMLQKAGYVITGIAASFNEAESAIHAQLPDIVLLDIMLDGIKTGIDFALILIDKNIPFIYLTANSNESVLNAVKKTQPSAIILKPFREKDVLVSVEMALYKQAHSAEAALRREQDLQISLLEFFSSDQGWDDKLIEAAKSLQSQISFDFILLGVKDGTDYNRVSSFSRIGLDEYQTLKIADVARVTGTKMNELEASLNDKNSICGIVQGDDFGAMCKTQRFSAAIAKTFKLESALDYQFKMTRGEVFVMSFYSKTQNAYPKSSLLQLNRLEHSLSLAIERLLAFEEIRKLSERLETENQYLQEEVKTSATFADIIGNSVSMQHVFDLIKQVAPTDASVMILGESGTGKELIARSIHNSSTRGSKLMVKVNCAALPANLIESELFGHERGAFTGAVEKRIGKFELANGGTIFLDEIGEIPIDLQAKLLRVLQEREIERLGGKGTMKLDVRVIAATNRDLEKEVSEGRFRLDLYYRLNVFPIKLPALRERTLDIPLLADFFARKFCKKIGRVYHGIHPSTLEELARYEWPGNIRELENVIEQSVIVSKGSDALELGRPLVNRFSSREGKEATVVTPQTLTDIKMVQQESEREYLIGILRKTNGRIRGRNGAAEVLSIKPTTLESKMKKLNITKSDIY